MVLFGLCWLLFLLVLLCLFGFVFGCILFVCVIFDIVFVLCFGILMWDEGYWLILLCVVCWMGVVV